MLAPPELDRRQEESILGRTSPLVKLGLALVWLIGLATTLRLGPPVVLIIAAVVAGVRLGGVPPRRLAMGLVPLVLAALSIAMANLVFSGSNTDPGATEIARLGALRITREAVDAALALGARVLAIVSVGGVFAQTTDSTRLVDSLVQQARVSPRFAYGALAAYQAVPRLGEDLTTLRQARRIRGLASTWHPRLFVGLLVRALRHADQLALAMDARAFDSGPRSTYRPVGWGWPDLVVAIGGIVVLAAALAT
jgi:energy-coupling factor transport system permease protein